MCIICHNSASSDQNNRTLMGVDRVRSVRRQGGPDVRVQDHAARHPLGWRRPGPVRGLPDPRHLCLGGRRQRPSPNWPTGAPTCRSSVDAAAPAPMTGYTVFGADPAVAQSCQTHNLYHPTYPRDLNDCAACHVRRLRARSPTRRRPWRPRSTPARSTRARARARVEEPARRHAAGRLGGCLHELPPARPTPRVMRTRMAGRRRPSRTVVRPSSTRSELMVD